jgi:hypothetical protein
VDKILKHDRNYNQAVTKVSEKEITKEIIQNDINALSFKLQELVNQSIIFIIQLLMTRMQKFI